MFSVFLESKLQNDQKLPKWNHWSHRGGFLGFLYEHSTIVATVQNLKTGYISSQYHVVFDYLFDTTVFRGNNNPVIALICNDIFDSSWDWYAEEEYDLKGQLIYIPPNLADVWLGEPGHMEPK